MSQPSTATPVAKRKAPRGAHAVQGGTSEANRRTVAVLEVLGGLRTPADAAAALGIAVPRYYQLETRALEGMVTALEPRSLGKQPSLEGRVARLQKELEQARRESARQQALVRVAQRSLGLKPPAAPNGPTPTEGPHRTPQAAADGAGTQGGCGPAGLAERILAAETSEKYKRK